MQSFLDVWYHMRSHRGRSSRDGINDIELDDIA